MNLWFVSVGVVVWVAVNAILIAMQRRPAASTIAWLLVLVFIPLVGW